MTDEVEREYGPWLDEFQGETDGACAILGAAYLRPCIDLAPPGHALRLVQRQRHDEFHPSLRHRQRLLPPKIIRTRSATLNVVRL